MVWLPSSLAMGECAVGTQSILYKKRSLKKNGTETIKMIQLWFSLLCASTCGAGWGVHLFLSQSNCFHSCVALFFSLEIVLKIREKHGEHNCCFRAMLLKSLLASIIILLFMCTWFISCFVSLSLFLLLLPFVHRMAERMQWVTYISTRIW